MRAGIRRTPVRNRESTRLEEQVMAGGEEEEKENNFYLDYLRTLRDSTIPNASNVAKTTVMVDSSVN